MGNELELCCKCEEPTGRAGRSEDSLYAGETGPFCEDCWGCVPDEQSEEIDRLNKKLAALRAESAESDRDRAVELLREAGKTLESARDCLRDGGDELDGYHDLIARIDAFLKHNKPKDPS